MPRSQMCHWTTPHCWTSYHTSDDPHVNSESLDSNGIFEWSPPVGRSSPLRVDEPKNLVLPGSHACPRRVPPCWICTTLTMTSFPSCSNYILPSQNLMVGYLWRPSVSSLCISMMSMSTHPLSISILSSNRINLPCHAMEVSKMSHVSHPRWIRSLSPVNLLIIEWSVISINSIHVSYSHTYCGITLTTIGIYLFLAPNPYMKLTYRPHISWTNLMHAKLPCACHCVVSITIGSHMC